jgi:hypothetical protein
LNGVYAKYPLNPDKQDAVFSTAARKIFDATTSGRGNSQRVVRGLVRAVRNGHLMLWSRDAAEQRRIRDGGIADAVDRAGGRAPKVGVYVSDAGASKMEYYLQMNTAVRTVKCFDNAGQELQVTTRLTSNAPPRASRLSPAIVGNGRFQPRGVMALQVLTMAPKDGRIIGLKVDGRPVAVSGGQLYGRRISSTVVFVPPGETVVLVSTLRTASNQDGDPVLDTTPGILPNGDSAEHSACG